MSTQARSHGLDGTLVEPDWPPLSLPEVRSLLRRCPGVGEPAAILSVSPRPFSAASVVAAGGRRVFVKRHHRSVRDREGLLEEHRLLAHLLAGGAPVPAVLASADGLTAIEEGEWTYEVHETVGGIDLYGEALSWTPFASRAHAHSAGRMIARLHRSAAGFDAPPRPPRPLVAGFSIFRDPDPAGAMERYIAARPALAAQGAVRRDAARALELLGEFHAELAPRLAALEPLWTHNDLHASNLLWSSAGAQAEAVGAFDFGLADRTSAVHDLAQAIERSIIEWLALGDDPLHDRDVPVHLDHLEAMLDGYEELRPLGREEALALAPMAALCHAELALTEADYFLGVLRSEERGRIATGSYLVGHAQWFRSPRGRSLLDVLRRRAGAGGRR